MKKRLCRAWCVLSCVLLLSVMFGCSHEQLPQESEESKTPGTQTADIDDRNEPSGTAADSLPESETDIRESQPAGNGGTGSDTDQKPPADPEETSDLDADSPKDPNQGEWDPQP